MTAEDGTFSINTGKECTCSIVVSYICLKTPSKKIIVCKGENPEVNFQLPL
jgi:hypothetical protein